MKKNKYRRHITSKWAKTKVLLPNAAISKHVPDTRRLNRTSLKQMLNAYGMVYVKPNAGTHGIGVIRIEDLKKDPLGRYIYQVGAKVWSFESYDELYTSLSQAVSNRKYLVQKGIHLLKYKGRRFDLRVMVQQSPKNKWVTTGVIGRVAAKGKAVTNVHNGGVLKSAEELLTGHVSGLKKRKMVRRLRRLGLKVAKQVHSRYGGVKELGLDIALDKKLYPWILEINTMPDPYIFRKLKDKTIFRRIYHYAKAYGRL